MLSFLQVFLPIVIYFLLIILLIIGIILGIRAIQTINKVDRVVEDVNEKVQSLNGFFNIIDFTTDKIVLKNTCISNFNDKLSILKSKSFAKGATLGPRILRAETAALSALSCWQMILGDWRK